MPAYKVVYDIYYRVPRYDIKGKEILKTHIYVTMDNRDRMIGGILENIVFLELKRRGYSVYVGKSDNGEIDFVAEKQITICLKNR